MAHDINRALEQAGHIPHADVEEHHPSAREYVKIAVILTAITSVEVAVYYIHALHTFIGYILITLSAIKFALVILWYMHLKFDNRLFRRFFLFGLAVAAGVIMSFLVLFDRIYT